MRVEVAIQENTSLPYPLTMEGYTLVGQAVGYDVGWTQHWVLTNQQTKEPLAPSTQQPRQSKKRIEALTQEPTEVPITKILRCLVKFIDKWQVDRVVEIPIVERVFGFETIALLGKDDILHLCNYEMIGQTELALYMRYNGVYNLLVYLV